jgi:hypothetical protein
VSLNYVLTDLDSVGALNGGAVGLLPRCTLLFLVGARNPIAPHDLNKPVV